MLDPQSHYKISASSFYNLSKCHRRVYMDLYGDPAEKGEYSDFMQLLWERGVQIEEEIIQKIKESRNVVAVKGLPGEDTFEETLSLMKKGTDWIYQGVLIHGDRIGRPDILQKSNGKSLFGDHHYIPCDIKSGRATDKKESSEVKVHYANQMLFYCDLLEKIQGKRPATAQIIDITGEATEFNVAEYEEVFAEQKALLETIVYQENEPEPLIGGVCTQCVWTKPCLKWANERQDPTLLYKVGKQRDDLRARGVRNIADLSKIDIADFLTPAKKIYRAAQSTLEAWKRRAGVWLNKRPLIHTSPNFRITTMEVFYDIEDDPSTDHVYLHGLIEVDNGTRGDYQYLLATSRESEEEVARQMWAYIDQLPENAVIYHYGSYENTKLKVLMEKYGLTAGTLEKFDRLRVDLYREVEKCSDWPLSSYGIKPIAKYLGFKWTAEDASGANSIAWYTEFRRDPENRKDLLEKILTYNREDCEAMMVVKDYLLNGKFS